MAITRNEIYTRIVNAVKAEYPTVYYSAQLEPVPSAFPAVYARMIGASVTQDNETLAFDSEIYRASWEVQIFSNKENDAGQEAYSIAKVVQSCMQSMGFLLDMLEPIDNIDPTVFRIIGRWHREVGYVGDSLPTVPEPEPDTP